MTQPPVGRGMCSSKGNKNWTMPTLAPRKFHPPYKRILDLELLILDLVWRIRLNIGCLLVLMLQWKYDRYIYTYRISGLCTLSRPRIFSLSGENPFWGAQWSELSSWSLPGRLQASSCCVESRVAPADLSRMSFQCLLLVDILKSPYYFSVRRWRGLGHLSHSPHLPSVRDTHSNVLEIRGCQEFDKLSQLL